jgi:hypothetical protein
MLLIPLILAVPALAGAQDWDSPWSDPRDRPARVDLSLSGGYAMSSDWSDLVVLGSVSSTSSVIDQVLTPAFDVDLGPVFGGSVSYSKTKYGFRVSAARLNSTLKTSGVNIVDVGTWSYDIRGTMGLVEYTPSRGVLPYLFVGVGGNTYNYEKTITPPLSSALPAFPPPQADVIVIERNGGRYVLEVDEYGRESVFAMNFGIGTDLRVPTNAGAIGVRLELMDHVSPSPLGIRIHELNLYNPASTVPIRTGALHHLRASAGLVVQFGR